MADPTLRPEPGRITGFNEYYDSHAGGVWMTVRLVRAMAQELGLQLSEIRWRRGSEIADLDSRSLVLGQGRRSICRKIPNEWLKNLAGAGRESNLEGAIRGMLESLQKAAID